MKQQPKYSSFVAQVLRPRRVQQHGRERGLAVPFGGEVREHRVRAEPEARRLPVAGVGEDRGQRDVRRHARLDAQEGPPVQGRRRDRPRAPVHGHPEEEV